MAIDTGKFRITQGDIKAEAAYAAKGPAEAVQFEPKVERVVREYEPRRIIKPGTGDYRFTRQNFGSIAATDTPKSNVQQRDSRFVLSHLVREPLGVNEEERRAIEARVRTEVDALAQETFNAAREAGFKQGLEEGSNQALAEAREQAAGVLDSISSLAESVEGHRARLLQSQERFLMELVLRIARRVCLKELSTDAQYVGRLIHSMVEQAGTRDNLRIRVSSRDLEALGSLRESLATRFGEFKNLSIEASPDLVGGSCEVESDVSSYSASLDSQFEAIEAGLLGDVVPAAGAGA